MERSFIQFYKNVPDGLLLQNGFSYVWDEANPQWIDWNTKDLPVNTEKVYVSAITSFTILKIWDWAEEHPEIQFIVGGPAVWPGHPFKELTKSLPDNLVLVGDFAEKIFDRPVNLKSWKLVPPKIDKNFIYVYHIDDTCEWSKCLFCRRIDTKPHEMREYDLEPLWGATSGTVYLAADSLSPEQLSILKELNYNDKQYRLYIRGTQQIYDSLKKVLNDVKKSEHLTFCMGVEFPSDRMLRWMNKGTTVKELLQVINLFVEHGCQFRLSYMTEWPNLTRNDLDEARKFFDSLENKDALLGSHFISCLTIGNKPWSEYKGEPLKFGNFIVGYKTRLSEQEKLLNQEWEKIVGSRNNSTFYFGRSNEYE